MTRTRQSSNRPKWGHGMKEKPEQIKSLVAAYEKTLRKFGLVDRDDPITEMIARKIVEIAQTGVHDRHSFQRWQSKKSASPKLDRHQPTQTCSIP
jgi:hypothetical protein